MYLSVNVYKIIAIIVLIPRIHNSRCPKNGNQMGCVACETRGGGGGDGKRACCGDE